ncbi:MAG: GNAT family N-acetyltransferase [Candidatus Avispirillum sp.]
MEIKIRNAQESDRERIRPLQREIAELHHKGRPDLFKTEARYFTEDEFAYRLNDPNHTVLIAETDTGEVVGYAFAWVIFYRNHSTFIDFDSFYIDDICVSKAFRRNGIGKMLFERCRQTAREKKCKIMDLGVYAFNKEAVAFYKKCGMTERILRMEYRLED